jgi:hypothetical protein
MVVTSSFGMTTGIQQAACFIPLVIELCMIQGPPLVLCSHLLSREMIGSGLMLDRRLL